MAPRSTWKTGRRATLLPRTRPRRPENCGLPRAKGREDPGERRSPTGSSRSEKGPAPARSVRQFAFLQQEVVRYLEALHADSHPFQGWGRCRGPGRPGTPSGSAVSSGVRPGLDQASNLAGAQSAKFQSGEFAMAPFEKLAVVGAGTMGSQIALQTAYSGLYEIALIDSSPEQLLKAREQNEKLVWRGVEKGRLTADRA